MKFEVTLKDPDGASDSLLEAANASVAALAGVSEDERESIRETRLEDLNEFVRKWMAYGEYLTVEFDTEAGTCVVVPEK